MSNSFLSSGAHDLRPDNVREDKNLLCLNCCRPKNEHFQRIGDNSYECGFRIVDINIVRYYGMGDSSFIHFYFRYYQNKMEVL